MKSRMKRNILIALLVIACMGIAGCEMQKGFQETASCSEDDYEWDGNIIIGLSDEGAAKTALMIPERCEGMGNMIFVTKENNVRRVSFESDKDIKIGGGFSLASNLTEITLPKELTEIPVFAFWKCESLKSITIPANVLIIDECAFDGDISLEEVVFEGNVEEIRKSAFEDCSALKEIEIPDSVWFFGEYAFSGCESLKKVTLPTGLTDVEDYVFYGCSGLKKIIVPEEVQLNTYTKVSLAQLAFFTFSKDAPTVKVVKGSWMDQNYDSVFGNFEKKYY